MSNRENARARSAPGKSTSSQGGQAAEAAAYPAPGRRTLVQDQPGLQPLTVGQTRKSGAGVGASPSSTGTSDDGSGAALTAPAEGPIPSGLLWAVMHAYHADIKQIDENSPFGKAVLAVWKFAHDNDPGLPRRTEMKAYAGSSVDSATKRRTIGELAARRARFEFLLGSLLTGGIRTGATWENYPHANNQGTDKSTNSGTLVNHYNNDFATKDDPGSGNYAGNAGSDWCGMFVGFAFSQVGMDPTSNVHYLLKSSTNAIEWANTHKAELGADGYMLPAEIDSRQKTPQAGDVVVFEHHVSMIEKFYPENKQIDTIDGNVGLRVGDMKVASDKVSGGSYTPVTGKNADGKPLTQYAPATSKAGVGNIRLIFRPGLAHFGATETPAGQPPQANTAGEALIAQLDAACHQLTDLYGQLQVPGKVKDDWTVSQIAQATAEAGG